MNTPPEIDLQPIRARRYEPADELPVLGLLQAAFGTWPRDLQGVTAGEFFRWKHMKGPWGPSTMLVTEADGRVIGFTAYMPWRFRAGSQQLRAARGVDMVVDPAYRRRGASMAVRAAARLSEETAFIWSNPNAQSRAGSVKAGRSLVARLPHFLRPSRRSLMSLRLPRGGGSRISEQPPVDSETAAELLAETGEVSWLPAPARDDRLATVRDRGYLRWRYGEWADYRAVRTGPAGDARGMAIFRMRRHGRFWVSHVCELFAARDERETVSRLLCRVGEAAPTDFISCGFDSFRQASRHGFVRKRSPTVLMAYPLRADLRPDPTRRDSWALSLGDLELL